MANVDNPHGLRPLLRTLGGGNAQFQLMKKDASEATAIFQWDAVNREADGNLDAASATPGTTLYSGVSMNYGTASKETEHLVLISPSAVFEAQDNNDTDGLAEADIGLNINIELNAGNAATGISGHELDESTVQTTNTLDLHVLGLFKSVDNAFGAFGRFEVVFNKHRMAAGVAGV